MSDIFTDIERCWEKVWFENPQFPTEQNGEWWEYKRLSSVSSAEDHKGS